MKLIKILIVLLLVLGGCSNNRNKTEVIEIVENDIYWVPSNPTNIMITSYNALSESLSNNNEVEIVKNIALTFAADFFTFKNKADENAVGGMTYVPEAKRSEVKEYFVFYFYKNFNSIKNQYGEENLPEVKSLVAVDPIATSFEDEDLGTLAAYDVRLSLSYQSTTIPSNALKSETVITVAKYANVWCVVEIK